MRFKAALVLLAALSLLPAAAQDSTMSVSCARRGSFTIRIAPRSFSSPRKDLALIEGRWQLDRDSRSAGLPAIHAVQIACDRQRMVCREAIAYLEVESNELRRAEADGVLGMRFEEYTVSKWSNTGFVATSRTQNGEVELRISTENRKGIRTLRGASAARWTLE